MGVQTLSCALEVQLQINCPSIFKHSLILQNRLNSADACHNLYAAKWDHNLA